jgi:hypothetical protein
MRKSRFTESQIVSILKDGDDGVPLADLVRKHGSAGRPTSTGSRNMPAPRSPISAE